MKCNKNFPSASWRVVSGEVTSGLIARNYVKETSQNGGQKKKDAEGSCQIRVAPGLGFLGQGLPGMRSCSLVGSWGMTPAQQGGENDPLTRRVVDPHIHVGVRYARRRTNNKCSISTGCNYETIDLTKKNVKNQNFRELYVLHFL
jgi:hypothetical protein